MLYGTARLITDFLEKGQPYSKVKKVYSVNVVYFSLGQGNDYIYKGRLDFRGLHLEDKLESIYKVKRKKEEARAARCGR